MKMTYKRLFFIALALLIILIIPLYFLATASQNKTVKKLPLPNTLIHIQQKNHSFSTPLIGKVVALSKTVVRMKTDGEIVEDNPPLTAGTTVKKGTVILELDHLTILYRLLKERTQFKQALQKALPEIKEKFPEAAKSWEVFEQKVHRQLPLPDLPKPFSMASKEWVSQLGIFAQYYKIKNTYQEAQNHLYASPVNGMIIKSRVSPGATIKEGYPLLTIARPSQLKVKASIPLKKAINFTDTTSVLFLNAKKDTIGKGVFHHITADSVHPQKEAIYFTISSDPIPLLEKAISIVPLKEKKESKGVLLPKSALKGDTVQLFNQGQILKLHIDIIRRKEDSVEVLGLPNDCFVLSQWNEVKNTSK